MYGPKDEGFFITLPSNASVDVFKENTSSSYRVDLPQHIDLEGSWEVALTQISYPHTFYHLYQEDAYFYWREKPQEPATESKVHRQEMRQSYFNGFSAFRFEMDGQFRRIKSDIYLVYDNLLKRFDFQSGGKTHVLFEGPLAYLMGMKSGEWFTFDQRYAYYPCDLRAGFYHMYCYSDVVAPQMVGDVYAPLLRTIDVKGTFGEIVTQYFNPAYYLPVSKNHIENIQVEIKTDQNKPVKFSYGKTIATLHFRPRT